MVNEPKGQLSIIKDGGVIGVLMQTRVRPFHRIESVARVSFL